MANLKNIKELGGEIAAIKLQISKMAGQEETKELKGEAAALNRISEKDST